ncbi:S-adenosyl-L-methionine-dependent methyltransferase [Dipodascopsis tothii]|uniref:S-adenosyl-L-methionine-dependent methyltransferase n=1 Tax=Dipodascopsis tothii TaxID=44089 RepID=UPI0034CF7396
MPSLPKPKVRFPRGTAAGAAGRGLPPRIPAGSAGGPGGAGTAAPLTPGQVAQRDMRKRFLIAAIGVYAAGVAGAVYYYSSQGALKPDEFVQPAARDTAETYENISARYDSMVNREELFMGLSWWRSTVVAEARGDVLEIACGTGRNVKYLKPDQVSSVTYVDAAAGMLAQAEEKYRAEFPGSTKARFVQRRIEDLTPAEGTYDTILETFGVCSHEDPVAVLSHLQRLLRPGGRILLLEHGRGTWDFINRILDKEAARRAEQWGCRWNLDIGGLVRDSGLVVEREDRSHFGTTWTIVARRPGDEPAPPPPRRWLW